jgi:hypothetical protein
VATKFLQDIRKEMLVFEITEFRKYRIWLKGEDKKYAG